MAATKCMEREGRWIPAFAGMTPRLARGRCCSGLESAYPPPPDVIPAKAGIHAFNSTIKRRDTLVGGDNP